MAQGSAIQQPKKVSSVWPARRWMIGSLVLSVLVSVFLFSAPALLPDVLTTLLGNANAAQPLAIAGAALSVAFLVGILISWTNPYKPPTLPDHATMQVAGGARQAGGLHPEKVLEEEFEYAASTAEQAMEHRMTIVNFYLLIAGGGGSGVVALVSANHNIAVAAVPLLWLIAAIGTLVTLQLISLRRAWASSAIEMNYVKEFFVANNSLFNGDDLAKAFLWKPTSLPDTHRSGNVSYYSVLLVAVLDAAAFFGGIFVMGLDEGITLTTPGGLIIGGAFAFLFLWLHLWLYSALLIPHPALVIAPATAPVHQDRSIPINVGGPVMQPTNYTPPTPTASANTVIASDEKYHGKILNLRVDDVRLPDGAETKREIVELAPAVVIIPYLEASDEFLFIEQYRDAIGQTLIELPAGKVQEGEETAVTAKRELLEETGYEAGEVRFLGRYYTSPGYSNEEHHLFLATKLQRVSGIQDTEEVHAIHAIKHADAVQMTIQGVFTDSKTVVGVLWGDRELLTHV